MPFAHTNDALPDGDVPLAVGLLNAYGEHDDPDALLCNSSPDVLREALRILLARTLGDALPNDVTWVDPSGWLPLLDPVELKESGLLFAINRDYLHPIGLALSVDVNRDLVPFRVGPIFDGRDDPAGITFADDCIDPEIVAKAEILAESAAVRFARRKTALGFVVQPLA